MENDSSKTVEKDYIVGGKGVTEMNAVEVEKCQRKKTEVFHLVTVDIKKSSRSQIKQRQWESEIGRGSQV